MNQRHESFDDSDLAEVDRLLAVMERGEISAEEEARLEALVCNSAAARQRYVLGLGLIASLEWEAVSSANSPTRPIPATGINTSLLDPSPGDSPLLGAPSADLPGSPLLSTGNPPATSWLSWFSRPPVLGFTAWTIAAMVLGAWIWFNHHHANQPLARDAEAAKTKPDESRVAKDEPSRVDPTATTYVARIVKASPDCRWGQLTTPVEFLVRLRAGDRMHIAAGLVELEFYSGARVILHGPAVFTPTGPESGHLESGRLTGEVAHGNFRLVTPAAEVIDLGTAFGVAADAAVGTDVVVFDGHVQVVSLSDGGRASDPLDMTQGMAARFRVDGSTEYGLHTDIEKFQRTASFRTNNSSTQNEICLVDVIAGGDGFGAGLAGAIDPLTGQKDQQEHHGEDRGVASNDEYHRATWSAIVDGVFIPGRRSRRMPVTSLGHEIKLPKSHGRTWGPIWARRNHSPSDVFGQDFYWGESIASEREGNWLKAIAERLKKTQNGLVGVHANVGITFDLQAVRLLHRRVPTEFRAAVMNIENARDAWIPPPRKGPPAASFHVFVDGKPQYERLAFRGEDGEAEFAVPLTAENRFLTIVSTDSGDGYFHDHVVLADPIIELAKEP